MNDDIRKEEELTNAPEAEAPEAAQPEEEKPEGKPKKSVGREIREWVVALAAAVLIALLIRTFLFTLIRVDGHSMDDTLHNGERLFVSVLDVRLSGVERGDVVICHYPNRTSPGLFGIETQTNFVKRVRGVPGDVVERKNNVTYINARPSTRRTPCARSSSIPTAIPTTTGPTRWARTSISSSATTSTTATIPAIGTTATPPATSAPSPAI